jgi:hypothetical protein
VGRIEAAGSLASVIVFRRPHKAGGGLHVHLSLRWFLTSDRGDGILRVGGGAECVEGAASSHDGRSRGKGRPGLGCSQGPA